MTNTVTQIHQSRADALTKQTGHYHDPRFVGYLMISGKILDYERGVIAGNQTKMEFLRNHCE